MQYKVIKDANRIVRNCPYVVNDPYKNKKRWSEVLVIIIQFVQSLEWVEATLLLIWR